MRVDDTRGDPPHNRAMQPIWNELAARAGRTISDEQHQKLSSYLDRLLAANQTMNLTRIVDRAAAEVQHVGDALTVLPHLPAEAFRLADVGSGGGVPGIPLAIVRPDAQVLLIESTKKKAAFLRTVVEQLELKNVVVTEERAEEVGAVESGRRQAFDVVVARAVATMVWLAEWCLPLARKGGKVLALKGPRVMEELPEARRAIKLLGGSEPILHPVDLQGTTHHMIVEIVKIEKTDRRYPRPAPAAKGNPIS